MDTGTLEEGCISQWGGIPITDQDGTDGGVVNELVGGVPRIVELLTVGLDCEVGVFVVHFCGLI